MPMSKTIAITGASGFIGQAICRRLHTEGWHIRALVRSAGSAQQLADCTDETVSGDIHDHAALEQLCRDTFAVVHCAGVVRGATAQAFDSVNVEGVRRLVEVLSAQDAPARLLCLSSLAAREPALSFYAASKYKGEQVLQQEADALQWIALRPPAVYGPGDRELLPLFRLMAKGIAPLPGVRDARFSMIFVEDIARLVGSWLRSDTVLNGVYSVHDGRQGGYSWADVINAVEHLCQRQVRAVRIPPAVFALPAWINRSLARWLGYAPMLTPEKLR
ncbi:MAG TPA: NAD(P)-dependent oxidoreductase, partial [Gammaproteobacteria bacterium]|nr:NAD(P)-dependent oxidoreductase [Gammaproteobacteria bacterium]